MGHGQSIIQKRLQEKKHGHVLVDVEFEGMDYTTIIRWNIKMNTEYINTKVGKTMHWKSARPYK